MLSAKVVKLCHEVPKNKKVGLVKKKISKYFIFVKLFKKIKYLYNI